MLQNESIMLQAKNVTLNNNIDKVEDIKRAEIQMKKNVAKY